MLQLSVRPALLLQLLLLLALLAVLAVILQSLWEPPADAHVPTIGALRLTPVDSETFQGFKAAMAGLGYQEGRTIRYRVTPPVGDIAHLERVAADHVAAGADLIFVSSTPATLAIKRATERDGLPVVFAPVNDPVGAGVVSNLRAPGGNLTGVRLPQGDSLRLQWLTRAVPGIRRVLLPYNPKDPSALESLRQVRETAEILGIELIVREIHPARTDDDDPIELPQGIDAIFLPRDSSVEARIAEYVAVALRRKLPLCVPGLAQVQEGALLSYGFVHREIGHQAARLADQVLRGIAPADLPVETARSYLAINLRTAAKIGVPISDELLRQAQVVIR